MLVRIMAAVIFTAAGASAGAAYSLRLRDSCGRCSEICDILRKITVYIRYTCSDVYEIAGRLRAECNELRFAEKLPERFTAGEDFHSCWLKALADEPLTEDERKILEELGSVLGTSDTEGQIAALAALEQRAGQLMQKYSDIYSKKGRLYRSVGVLAGAMVGILVI